MKKIIYLFVFLYIFSYTFYTNASFLNLESTQTFYISQGIVESRPIKLDISGIDDNNQHKEFSLTLPEDSNIRFSQDFSAIKISGLSSAKIGTGITIDPNLRVLKFNLQDSFRNGDSIDITGVKLKVYSKVQGDKYLGVDLNLDNINDSISANGYRVIDTYSYSDLLAPSEIFNFSGSILNNKIIISADIPGDLDFQAVILENLDSNGKVLSSFLKYDLNNFSYDMQTGYDSIRVKTVDIRANYSEGLIYKLDSLNNPQSVLTNSGTTLSNSGLTLNSSGTILSNSGSNINSSIGIIDIIKIEKYNPTFVNQKTFLDKVVLFIDDYISKNIKTNSSIEKQNLIMTIRNNLIKELEKLDLATYEEKSTIVQNIRNLFKELIIELKI